MYGIINEGQLDHLTHRHIQRLQGSAAILTKTSRIVAEFEAYVTIDFFSNFWLADAKMFPIISRIARRIMVGSASDVERLFSNAGIIFSPLRSNLVHVTLQHLTTLHH